MMDMDIRSNTLSEYFDRGIELNPSLASDEFYEWCYDQACLEYDDGEPGSYVAGLYASPEAKTIIGYVEVLEEYMEG